VGPEAKFRDGMSQGSRMQLRPGPEAKSKSVREMGSEARTFYSRLSFLHHHPGLVLLQGFWLGQASCGASGRVRIKTQLTQRIMGTAPAPRGATQTE
jgi:hypothetical protein